MTSSEPSSELSAFDAATERVRGGADAVEQAALLLGELTSDERLWLLDGDQEFWAGMGSMAADGYNATPIVMGAVPRLGIPGLRFSDGPRGVVLGRSTAFPVSMARGATWDLALEERIGLAIGREMRAQGGNFYGGVCVNLPRHPAWGRAQETYGEDPLTLGEFGAALTRGVRRNGMAVVKHFAVNSMENARFSVDVQVDDAALHEVFLPHFRRVIEEGADGVMTAYNAVNGEWAGQNEHLMEGVLRGEWGFEGVTVSDFIFGLRDAALSLRAGLDVEEPFRQQRAEHLSDDLAAGRAQWEDVDRSALRILATQLRHAASDLEPAPDPAVVFSDEHRTLAREAAAAAVVLLKNAPVGNAPVLPLDAGALSSLALLGRLADRPNTGDAGSSNVRSPEVATPLQGLQAALPDTTIVLDDGEDLQAAAETAKAAEVAVVVVGYTALDEGEYLGQGTLTDPALLALFPPAPEGTAGPDEVPEGASGAVMGDAAGGDRASLRLLDHDVALIRAVAAANPRTVVVIITAGAVLTEEWRTTVPALVIGWYSGSEGGHGLADALLGRTDVTGRLPYSIPTSEEHLPTFDRRVDAKEIVYDRWFGQRLLDRLGVEAAFPLGSGLSYTSFRIDDLQLDTIDGESFRADIRVTNTGARRGRHVVQLYAVIDADDFPTRVLVGFAPVWVEAGATQSIRIDASTRPLMRWASGAFTPAAAAARIEAAGFAGDPSAITRDLPIT